MERPRPWGQGKEIRLASLPAVLLSIPWGMFTRELVRPPFKTAGRTSARAGLGYVAGNGSAVAPQGDAAEVQIAGPPIWETSANWVTVGREGPPNTAPPQHVKRR